MLANWLATESTLDVNIETVEGLGLFAAYFVLAQAMERFVEPISHIHIKGFGSSKKDKEHKRDLYIKAARTGVVDDGLA